MFIQDNQPDNSAQYKITKKIYPTYNSTNPNIIDDPKDMNSLVCLRNQHVRIHMQNASTTETASVTLFMVELKKDVLETQINVSDMLVIEDLIAAGWSEEFGLSDSNNPPIQFESEQYSYFFMRENPVFQEYFKICYAKAICFQPGQIVTQSFSMKPMQILSYKFMGKNQFTWNGVPETPEAKWLHVAHKKGEKVFFVKQHGQMSYAAEPAGPGYANSSVNYWFESEWEAAEVSLNADTTTVDGNLAL